MTTGYELFADEIDGCLYAAVVRKGVLYDLYSDAVETPIPWATIYQGKVSKVDTRLDAALVDLGNGQTGILPGKHVRFVGADESESRSGISSLLTPGQMIIVQVKAEGKKNTEHENQKLPRLTMQLYISGLCLAYSPNSNQVTISRKVESEKILALTAKLKGRGGWIIRRHIDTADIDHVEHEVQVLHDTWQAILEAQKTLGDKPGVLKIGPDALNRALTDYGAAIFEHIHVGSKKLLESVMEWSAAHLPPLADSKRLRLYRPERSGQTLFDIHDLYGELEALHDSRVHLESGATLVIEPTAALTFIDVNQGAADSIAVANQAAARALARQCRLRNLSGAILVDFINMDHKEERHRLLDTLNEVFTHDMAHAQIHGFTRLGIMELTRKRRTASFAEKHVI